VIQASEGAKGVVQVDLDGRMYEVRAKVRILPGYSGHKDQAGLLGFVKGMQRAPERIVLVHGERRSKILLASALKQAFACGTQGPWVSIPD